MKKKALLKDTLSVVLAVAVLALLFIGAWKVYSAYTKDSELEKARSIIDKIKAKSDALSLGQQTTQTIQGFDSVEQWYVLGWGKDDPSAPDKCFFSSCICICSSAPLAENCQERGICEDVETDLVLFPENSIIKTETKIETEGPGKTVDSITANFIQIPENFIEIKIEKGLQNEKTFLKIT